MTRKYTYIVTYKRPFIRREFTIIVEAFSVAEAAFIAGHSFPMAVDVDLVSVELK